MSIATPIISAGRPNRHVWTGQEFDRASESGLFDGQRVELINGEILELPPMNDPHAQAVRLANYALLQFFPPDRATISIQLPMRLGESRPFPDLAVVSGTPRQVVTHPTTAILVVEVSDTTLEYDQTEKAVLYAANSIPEYWIVNLNARCVEVHTQPSRGRVAKYGVVRPYREDQTVSLSANPQVAIKVADLLP